MPFDEYLDLPDKDDEIETEVTSDGGMIARIGDNQPPEPMADEGFYRNLAVVLPEMVLNRLASDLMTKIDQDKEARKKRDAQYEEGMRRTGLGNDAPGGAQFEGASKVVHPALVEACIDGEARLMKELWPPSGPVKPKILGEVTHEKQEKADRKVAWMNRQLTTLMKEARSVTETTLMQVMLGGSQFVKLWFDHRLMRPRMQFVGVDRILLPAAADDYYSSFRKTFMDKMAEVEFRQRVDSDQYRDLKLSAPSMQPEPTKTETANKKIEGVEDTGTNIDGEREVYEVTTFVDITQDMMDVLDIEEQGKLYPYILSIDFESKRVLSMYRDWEEDDPLCEPIEHIFEFPMIPWRGPYSLGFCQIIGGLSGAMTGALRALLDSAHIANVQGGLILKGAGTSGQSKKAQPGEFVEIDGNMAADDIRKLVMQFNTKEPSNVLYLLLGNLVEMAKGVVRTSLDESPADERNKNVPVGTQLSRVEEGLVVFSAIHGRTHTAFNRLLEGLHRINRMYLREPIKVDLKGKEIMVYPRDFQGPVDVQPVSDPTIYSDQQRFGQISAVEMSAMALSQNPIYAGLYDMRAIQARKLKLWKVPDPEELLPKKPEPHELNPINENLAMGLGQPVAVFPDQDHLAHIAAHFDFAMHPALGSNPIIFPKFMPGFLKHVSEHMLYHYVACTNDLVTDHAGMPAARLFSKDDDEVKRELDQLLAMAGRIVSTDLTPVFQNLVPILQAGMQKLQSMMPPPPMDPGAAALKAAGDETKRKTAADETKGKTDAAKIMNDQRKLDLLDEKQQMDATAKQETLESQEQIADAKNQTTMDTSLLETTTAKEIAGQKIAHDQTTQLRDGASLSKS